MKHKWLKIGICLLVIGIIGLCYMGTVQAKVNINRMTAADWQDSHIEGIGTATQAKLLTNAPYADIKDTGWYRGPKASADRTAFYYSRYLPVGRFYFIGFYFCSVRFGGRFNYFRNSS